MLSRVFRATPPKVVPAADGRIKTDSKTDNSSMRVLSPKILPPLEALEGSMVRMATFIPLFTKTLPKASINVLFPTPGTPVIPIRIALPEKGKHF